MLADVESDAPRPTRTAHRLFLASVALAVLPIAVALVRAVAGHWVPAGDRAIFAIRARDVLSAHPPLIGAWTSASVATGVSFNNPGPLQYDLLALPTRVFGSAGSGIAIGVALVNIAAVVALAIVAFRRGGALAGTLAMTVAAALAWSMGTEALVDPLQPYALVFPFLLLLALVWSVACGDLVMFPIAVGVAGYVLQTYVTFGYLVAALGGFALVMLLVRWRTQRRRVLRMLIVSAVVFVVCWAQPLVEQFTTHPYGNIRLLYHNLRHAPAPIGERAGTKVVARVLSLPPFWFRPSFSEFPDSGRVTSPALVSAVLSLAVLLGVVVLCGVLAWRRRDRVSAAALTTSLVAIGAGLVTAWRTPQTFFGVSSHVFRWLWPGAAFTTFAIVLFGARWIVRRIRTDVVVACLVAVTAVFALLAVPYSNQGASARRSDMPVVRDLGHQIGRADVKGPVVFDFRDARFADPLPSALLAELQAHGIRFVTPDEGYLVQLGRDRKYTGNNARAGIVIREGDTVDRPPRDARLIARHNALSPAERAELTQLEGKVAAYVETHGVVTNARGRRAVQRGDAVIPTVADAVRNPWLLVGLIDADGLVVDPATSAEFTRYAALRNRWNEQTVAVYLTPVAAVVPHAR
jgi:hypothetical protein